MIKKLLEGSYPDVQLFHVRMAFSKEMDKVGKFRLSKILHLALVISRIVYFRLRYGIDLLYYPPAGPNRLPMYRDLAILISTRWLFRRTVFHFHAGGISELYPELSPIARFLFRVAYLNADAAIVLSELNPPDGRALKAKQEYVIPYGIQDRHQDYGKSYKLGNPSPRILFVGVLKESKGVLVLLEACGILAARGVDFTVQLVGKFESVLFEGLVQRQVAEYRLGSRVEFLGVLIGNQKYKAFSEADIFCLPTFFESESFGVVLLEAMMFGLPVVATRWRGIPSVVQDGESGYLVPVRDGRAVADRLEFLIKNPDMAKQMGRRGREEFLTRYTIDRYHRSLGEVFLSVEAP